MAFKDNNNTTNFTSVTIVPDPNETSNGFYPPILTQTEIDNIPFDEIQPGGIIYNITVGSLQTYTINGWENVASGGGSDTFTNITVTDTTTTQTLIVNDSAMIMNLESDGLSNLNNVRAVTLVTSSIAGNLLSIPSIAPGEALGTGGTAVIFGSTVSGRIVVTVGPSGGIGGQATLATISLNGSSFTNNNFGVIISPNSPNTTVDTPLARFFIAITNPLSPAEFIIAMDSTQLPLAPGSIYAWYYIVVGNN